MKNDKKKDEQLIKRRAINGIFCSVTGRSKDWMVKTYAEKHFCCPIYADSRVSYKVLAKNLNDTSGRILVLMKLHKIKETVIKELYGDISLI